MAALVIGNSAYPDGNELDNPINDAKDFGAKLKHYGFEVIVATDCTAKVMDMKLKAFRQLLETHEVGLFFFAGHGMQIDGSNYLLAIDTDMEDEDDAKFSSLALDKVVSAMAKSKAMTKIIILDACRSNPWERKWQRAAGARGLASVYAPKGTIIGFATSPGETANDGDGKNGTYTGALLAHIDAPDVTIETMFKRVRNTVAAATGGKQTSWEHTSLSGEFYFNLGLGNLIDEYDPTALADRLFVIDPSRKSHKVIAGLRTHNWYSQNDAVNLLDAAAVAKIAKDNLFVIGRNIYQAACGGSNNAEAFVKHFMSTTSGYPKEKRKAMLDGMLFEIFFNKDGKRRDKIKSHYFNEVFELQQYEDVKDSFDFIAESLTATGGDFYAVPGKGHDLAVTIATKKTSDGAVVEAIYVGATDVLRREGDWADGKPHYIDTDADHFEERLSEQLVVPPRSLKISYTPARPDELRIPMGWTVRKQQGDVPASVK